MNHVHDAAFWDQMYRDRHGDWDGEPNPVLARAAEDLAPGAALDLGCGEGADALWLADRGWAVTAVDLSGVALERARAEDAAQRVNWIQADMAVWQPPADAYDLVSLHYVHIPLADRARVFERLAQAVRPNGQILVVAHHPSDLETSVGRPPNPELYFTAEEVAAALTVGRWEVLFGGTEPRDVRNREGRSITIHDMVLRARRLA